MKGSVHLTLHMTLGSTKVIKKVDVGTAKQIRLRAQACIAA